MKDTSWIPNWCNPDEYPDTEETSLYQWAWEFLRRNHTYQKYCDEVWKRYLRPPPEIILDTFSISVSSSFPHYSENDPTVKEIYSENGRKWEDSHFLIFQRSSASIATPIGTEAETLTHKVKQIQINTVSPNIVAPIIDLAMPINTQLTAIKERLLGMQKQRKLVNKRLQADKFPLYLRILDALETTKDNNLIAEQVFPDIDNSYPDYSGSGRVKDTIVAASRFRDEDYKVIAVESKLEPRTYSRSLGLDLLGK
jgi:hypothetical protein